MSDNPISSSAEGKVPPAFVDEFTSATIVLAGAWVLSSGAINITGMPLYLRKYPGTAGNAGGDELLGHDMLSEVSELKPGFDDLLKNHLCILSTLRARSTWEYKKVCILLLEYALSIHTSVY